MYKKSLFWFRQDFRVQDNTGLFEAVHSSEKVLPIFILDETIAENFGGFSDQKFGFIREALERVSKDIISLGGEKVIVFKGKPKDIILKLVKKYNIECVFCNTSYGQRGKKRDQSIAEQIHNLGCNFESYKDYLLVEPQEIETRKVFTPYYKLWNKYLISEYSKSPSMREMSEGQRELRPKIEELKITHFTQFQIQEQTEAKDFISLERHPFFTLEFGEYRLQNHILSNYDDTRNNLDLDGTSMLSPYLRHGIFSIRQIYNRSSNESFISELAWREFWHHIYHHFPFTKDTEFLEKRRNIAWSHDSKLFESWCKGATGYPVVDAAMQQLNTTNWIHGRARMIVASFLTKDLHIDWRLGEAYFREKLLDYDEAVNIGNWQWSASVGADPKPLRIFNPILQSERFSKDAKYIKKYLPKLTKYSSKEIHSPLFHSLGYQKTIVDHGIEQRKTRELYKNADIKTS